MELIRDVLILFIGKLKEKDTPTSFLNIYHTIFYITNMSPLLSNNYLILLFLVD